MSLSFISGISMVVSGLISFVLNYNHLLNNLLSLELMGLGVYWGMTINLINSSFFMCFFFLIMLVCEGVLGLSLLVASVWSHNSEMMSGFNCLKW